MYFASHKIPTDNLPKLDKQVKALNNKAVKARVSTGHLVTQRQHEVIEQVGYDDNKRPVYRSYTWVTFLSKADFVLEGYQFIARYDFERDVDGNPVCFVHAMPEAEVPTAYRETDGHCDHCNTKRFRKNTFLVLNTETGEYKLFGRQCLQDIFTVSPAQIASLFELVRNPGTIAGGLDDEYVPGMKMTHYDLNDTVLGWAVSAFNQSGFVSKAVAYDQDRQSTAELVDFIMMPTKDIYPAANQVVQKELRERYEPTDSDRADVDTLKTLIIESDDDGEYIEKLQKVIAAGHVSRQNFALLVSAVTQLKKHRVAAERAEAVKDVPDVIEGRQQIIGEVVSFREEPGFGYYDDPIMKVLLRDAEGRKYWGTYPKALGQPEQGDKVELTATVSQGKDDSKFGIFKRPAKASVISQQTEAA